LKFESYSSWDELDETDVHLLKTALDSAANAYAPYSRFRVGAAILLEDGSVVCGNNQENASYPQGMCAERVALFSAAAQFPEKRILTLALVAEKSEMPLSPCGGCRQVLLEYEQRQDSPIRLLMGAADGSVIVLQHSADLLPFSFSKENLNAVSRQAQ
jgi:cytidine deaminase